MHDPAAATTADAFRPVAAGTLRVTLRTRSELWPGSGRWEAASGTAAIPAAAAAVLVCDMWDAHWCPSAARRVDAMVPRMESVLHACRARGVQIIHAPSDTMDRYAGTPERRRAQLAPAAPPAAAQRAPAAPHPPLPIDDADGGCDDAGDRPQVRVWTRQHPGLTISGFDAVTDDGDEVYNVLRHLGIDHLFIMGVHTNMCVLNRSFAIRAMTRRGIRCVLVRDLTDAMYNPARPPHVSHDQGTDLVVEYIERYYCPSVLSADLCT